MQYILLAAYAATKSVHKKTFLNNMTTMLT